jgi:hypothetical protein
LPVSPRKEALYIGSFGTINERENEEDETALGMHNVETTCHAVIRTMNSMNLLAFFRIHLKES